jgi:hypothetical protein
LHALGFFQLRGLLDEDFAVELDDVQRLQHVVLLDYLLRLRDENARHSASLLPQTDERKEKDTRDATREQRGARCTYAEERAVEVADGEELPDVAAGDGAAAEARAADDGEARGGELDQGLELGGLLGGALAEEAHDDWPAGCCERWCSVGVL